MLSLSSLKTMFNIVCKQHTNEPIINIYQTANGIYYGNCKLCPESGDQNTKSPSFVASANEIRDRQIFDKLQKLSKQEGNQNYQANYEGLSQELDALKEKIDIIFNETKQYILGSLHRNYQRKKSWNTISEELDQQYVITFKDDLNVSIDNQNVQDFLKNYQITSQYLNSSTKESIVKTYWYKDMFKSLSTQMSDIFVKNRDKLFKIEKVKPQATRSMNSLNSGYVNFQPNSLTRDRVLKTGYEFPIKPTAITYLERLHFFATGFKREITLFGAWDYEKKHSQRKVHSDEITHLNYSKKAQLLYSAAADNFINIHKVNKSGFMGIYKKIQLGQGNAITGLLIKEDKNILIGCGRDRYIKVWNLMTLQSLGQIKTFNETNERILAPHMAYCNNEGLLAAFFPNTKKLGVFCMRRRKLFTMIETNLKESDVFSINMTWIQRRSLLVSTKDFGKLGFWSFKNRKYQELFNISITGYSYGLIPFEDQDYLLVMTFMKELQIVNLYTKRVISNVMTGLKNGSNLIHMKDQRKILIPDPVYERISIMKY